jgi:putative transposase
MPIHRYGDRFAEAGIDLSVGRVGDIYDSVLAMKINELFKVEVFDRQGPWYSIEALKCEALECEDWFNNRVYSSLSGA